MINCVITIDEWIKFAGKGVVMLRHITMILVLDGTCRLTLTNTVEP